MIGKIRKPQSKKTKAAASTSAESLNKNIPRRRKSSHPAAIIQRVEMEPGSLTHEDAIVLQRTIGNQAVCRLMESANKNSAKLKSGTSAPVQRYVFINEEQLTAEEHDGTETEIGWIGDNTIRNYEDTGEFSQHASGTTDYIGNLPAPSEGTWVRFEPDGTNVIGENHTEVVLHHVLGAVGSKDFIHERFLDIEDTADQVPKTFQVYTADTASRDEEYGLEEKEEKRKYAAETLVPKLGYGGQLIGQYLKTRPLKFFRSTGNGGPEKDHIGKVSLKVLRQMWAYAEDVVNWFGSGYEELPDTELLKWVKIFIPFYLKIKDLVDPFISELVYGEALGDTLDTNKYRDLAPLIMEFSQILGDTIYIQALEYEESGVTGDREELLKAGAGGKTNEEKKAVLNQWRNKRFKELVTEAINGGTRYAGMGANHLEYLLTQEMPGGMHSYNLSSNAKPHAPTKLPGFETKTQELRQKVV